MIQRAKDPITMRVAAFRRVLQLESERGYQNKTVVGGIDRFLDRWRSDLTDAELRRLSTSLTTTLAQRNYESLTKQQRERWAYEALAALTDQESLSLQELIEDDPAKIERDNKPIKTKPSQAQTINLESPPTMLKGVGPSNAFKLEELNIQDIRGILYHYPSRHIMVTQISQLAQGEELAIVGSLWSVGLIRMGKGGVIQSTEAIVGDETGNIRVMWFNQPYVARYLRPGNRIIVNGYFRAYRGKPTFEANGYEVVQDEEQRIIPGRLLPVYPTKRSLPQRTLRRIIDLGLTTCLPKLSDHLNPGILQRQDLLGIRDALQEYHQPISKEAKLLARKRLAFDEIFIRQIFMLTRRQEWQDAKAIRLTTVKSVMRSFISGLPFTLTKAQTRSLDEVLSDIASETPTRRLLEGEVGSGKTVVALAAMLNAVAHGYQAALMAPTEILAQQHFETIAQLLEGMSHQMDDSNTLVVQLSSLNKPITIGVILGSHTKRQKERIRQKLEAHEVDIVVGTHSLIQNDVSIPHLALAVVDEEHRFGVTQRGALGKKGNRPHLISMSATPIPRSLALTFYGDMDISVIDELPPGRIPSKTRWLRPDQREQANRFIRKEVSEGHQAFVVCPIIDESDSLQTSAAVEEHRRLSKEIFRDLNIGLLHGRMNLRDKTSVMESFRAGEIDLLVCTPVVEVGVDIPNATIMMIEGADRFGLSALHQLRGRVGRSSAQGYCILMAENPSEDAQARLNVMEKESNGFRIAEEDLNLRGHGEITGTKQSGIPDMKLASLRDTTLLTAARREATGVLHRDPKLEKDEHQLLAEAVGRLTNKVETETAETPSKAANARKK